jgi:predicted metal-dependent HD superfamily phosphohydrolase
MTHEVQQVVLAESWNQLMDTLRVDPGSLRLNAFAQLVAAYSESHRYWHNLDHIESLLADLKLPRHGLHDELASVELAVWYHDVVYDPRGSENESCSAEVATNSLRELDIDEYRIARVCELVRMTKDHQASQDDRVAQLFLDADMSILGTNPVLYAEYAEDIRKEYAWVPDREFHLGRRAVLLGFLHRPTIFRTDWFKQWEAAARANIAAEVARLDERLSKAGT